MSCPLAPCRLDALGLVRGIGELRPRPGKGHGDRLTRSVQLRHETGQGAGHVEHAGWRVTSNGCELRSGCVRCLMQLFYVSRLDASAYKRRDPFDPARGDARVGDLGALPTTVVHMSGWR